VLDKE
jgi:hypothetical protein